MVATRQERIEKLVRYEGTGRLIRPAARQQVRTPAPHMVTSVNLFDVSTLTNGETVAFPSDGSPAPQLEIRVPTGSNLDTAHELAVAFIRRRGPGYLPAAARLVITLDERGRLRDTY